MARKIQYSHTKLDTFLGCPRQYKYIYVDKLKRESSLAMQVGLCMHKIAEVLRKSYHMPYVNKHVKQIMATYNIVDMDSYRLLLNMVEMFMESWEKDEFRNSKSEIRFEFQTPAGNTIMGYIDLIIYKYMEKRAWVYDYKTSKIMDREPQKLMQLQIYDYAVKKMKPGIEDVFVGIYYTRYAKKFVGQVNHAEDFGDYLDHIIKSILKSKFPPKPNWKCQLCNFSLICPGPRKTPKHGINPLMSTEELTALYDEARFHEKKWKEVKETVSLFIKNKVSHGEVMKTNSFTVSTSTKTKYPTKDILDLCDQYPLPKEDIFKVDAKALDNAVSHLKCANKMFLLKRLTRLKNQKQADRITPKRKKKADAVEKKPIIKKLPVNSRLLRLKKLSGGK